jgi:hypothetical protein
LQRWGSASPKNCGLGTFTKAPGLVAEDLQKLFGYQVLKMLKADSSGAADGQSFSGSGQWTYKKNGYSCNGTNQVTGTKLADAQVDATGSWSGNFTSNKYSGVSGTFAATIVDTAGQLTENHQRALHQHGQRRTGGHG